MYQFLFKYISHYTFIEELYSNLSDRMCISDAKGLIDTVVVFPLYIISCKCCLPLCHAQMGVPIGLNIDGAVNCHTHWFELKRSPSDNLYASNEINEGIIPLI